MEFSDLLPDEKGFRHFFDIRFGTNGFHIDADLTAASESVSPNVISVSGRLISRGGASQFGRPD